MILDEIISAIHAWAPPGIAQSYDNVGLQVGDPGIDVKVGLVALELTPDVIQEAEELGAQLIVTHHPLLFRPIRSLSPTTLVGSMALRLARAGIATVAAHTNLDGVADGVSAVLADLIGLADQEFLSSATTGTLKLVTFVPDSQLERVRDSVHQAGGWRVGDRADIAFQTQGVGIFRPIVSSGPFSGASREPVEDAPEWRLEVSLTRDRLSSVVNALLEAHPYENPVYDVYEPTETVSGFGLGMIGNLSNPIPLPEFLANVCRTLNTKAIRYAGDLSAQIGRVAVCGGAGRDFISAAMRKGADAYLTSDLTYHTFFDVMHAETGFRMALIDAGHYETEAATEQLLLRWLTEHVPSVGWTKTAKRTSPISTFIAP